MPSARTRCSNGPGAEVVFVGLEKGPSAPRTVRPHRERLPRAHRGRDPRRGAEPRRHRDAWRHRYARHARTEPVHRLVATRACDNHVHDLCLLGLAGARGRRPVEGAHGHQPLELLRGGRPLRRRAHRAARRRAPRRAPRRAHHHLGRRLLGDRHGPAVVAAAVRRYGGEGHAGHDRVRPAVAVRCRQRVEGRA